jgi:hypothetical protein
LSWFAVGLGILLGLLGLVLSGQAWVDADPNSQVWLTSRFEVAGPALLGLVFLVASFAALRSRRCAGLILLGCTPVTSFVLSYPSAGYLIWGADGGGSFYLPLLPTAVGLACLFYLPFVAPLLVIRNRRRALFVFLIAAILAALPFVASRWTAALLPLLAGWSAFFLVFGGFWLLTSRKGWPALVEWRSRSVTKGLAIALIECLAVAVLVVAGSFGMAAWRSSLYTGNCRGPHLFVRPVRPGHVVFTARLIWAGHTAKVSGKWAGDWAIGVVREHFWGLPSWAPHVVLLYNHMFIDGETFFVSGRREKGILTRFLPIVDAQTCGTYYAWPVAYAKIQLQLLREPPAAGESRIMGYVRSPLFPVPVSRPRATRRNDWAETYEWAFNSPARERPLAGARIRVTGSSGSRIVTTDGDGIYVLAGLPPDDYTLRLLDVPADQIVEDRSLKKEDMIRLGQVQLDISTDWDGSIEGIVGDVAGGPVRVSLDLQNADGTPLGPEIMGSPVSGTDGSFRFRGLPAGGRYVLLINPFGPYDDSPYPRRYYPAAERREDARVFEIGGSDHTWNVRIAVNRLVRRDLRVHAIWPNGQPADDTWVHLAYENARGYEDPVTSALSQVTDRTGVAELHTFGDSRIRVQAEKAVDDQKGSAPSRYSAVVELETTTLPRSLDLVLSTSRSSRSR